jgi:hypothetical protein
MSKLQKFCGLILVISLLSLTIFAQKSALPKLRKGEGYKSVRVKMIKAGWKPFHSKDADKCMKGDERCQNRPEMEACAGTGQGNCRFLWKRKGKTVAVFTIGDNTVYDGFEFQ